MKIYWAIIGFIIFVFVAFIQANDLDKKEKQIKELESQVYDLKLKQHTDSLINYHVAEFRKKLGLPIKLKQ